MVMYYRKRSSYLYRRDARRAGWSWSRGSWCHCCWRSCRPFATGCTPDSRRRTESLPEASSLHTHAIVAAITPQCGFPPDKASKREVCFCANGGRASCRCRGAFEEWRRLSYGWAVSYSLTSRNIRSLYTDRWWWPVTFDTARMEWARCLPHHWRASVPIVTLLYNKEVSKR